MSKATPGSRLAATSPRGCCTPSSGGAWRFRVRNSESAVGSAVCRAPPTLLV
jgi:hypothetical protein